MENAIKTFGVLAGAYANSKPAAMLTHSVEFVAGDAVRVLCSRVKLESMCTDYPSVDGYDEAPECKSCARALAKRARS